MASLFDKAKKKAPAKVTKAKEEKLRIRVKEEGFFDKIKELQDLQDNMKRDKAKADMISDEIKEVGKVEWSKQYGKTSKNPGSIMLEAKHNLDTAQFMFVPSDKYITINEDRANFLIETFGEESVEEKTKFEFDEVMVDKYGQVLSEMIESSDEIDEEDKEKIIKAITSYNVAKGAIDKFKSYAETAELDVFDVVEQIKPVIAIKNVEVLKG